MKSNGIRPRGSTIAAARSQVALPGKERRACHAPYSAAIAVAIQNGAARARTVNPAATPTPSTTAEEARHAAGASSHRSVDRTGTRKAVRMPAPARTLRTHRRRNSSTRLYSSQAADQPLRRIEEWHYTVAKIRGDL